MVRSVTEILLRYNIRGLQTDRNGRYYTTCPRCSDTRLRHHKKLKCLGVTITDRGVHFGCNHCDWKGGGFYATHKGAFRGRFKSRQTISLPALPIQPDQDAERRRSKAQWLYRESVPARGTVVELYLKSRGITVAPPATVRYLPPLKPGRHPTMVVPFAIPEEIEPGVITVRPENISGVHLTLLKPGGSGKIEETEGTSAKLILGPSRGMPLVVAPPNDLLGLIITEGIEDAASAHQVTGLGAWAAGCASRLPALADVVPAYIESVTIFVDDDQDGRRCAGNLAAQLLSRNIETRIVLPSCSPEMEIAA